MRISAQNPSRNPKIVSQLRRFCKNKSHRLALPTRWQGLVSPSACRGVTSLGVAKVYLSCPSKRSEDFHIHPPVPEKSLLWSRNRGSSFSTFDSMPCGMRLLLSHQDPTNSPIPLDFSTLSAYFINT